MCVYVCVQSTLNASDGHVFCDIPLICCCVCYAGGVNEDTVIVLQCLDVMLSKRRKQVTLQRAQAFLKRLNTVALHLLPDSCVGILSANRMLMQVRRDAALM